MAIISKCLYIFSLRIEHENLYFFHLFGEPVFICHVIVISEF